MPTNQAPHDTTEPCCGACAEAVQAPEPSDALVLGIVAYTAAAYRATPRCADDEPVDHGQKALGAVLAGLSEIACFALLKLGAFGDGPEIAIAGEFGYEFEAVQKAAAPSTAPSLAAWFRAAQDAGEFAPQFS